MYSLTPNAPKSWAPSCSPMRPLYDAVQAYGANVDHLIKAYSTGPQSPTFTRAASRWTLSISDLTRCDLRLFASADPGSSRCAAAGRGRSLSSGCPPLMGTLVQVPSFAFIAREPREAARRSAQLTFSMKASTYFSAVAP